MPAEDSPYDVLCYGTISVDHVTRVPHLPSSRRDTQAISEHDELGGEALKVAIRLARWGLRVLVVGSMIGADGRAQLILDELARYPTLDTRYIRQSPDVATSFSRILVTPDGERSRIAYGRSEAPKIELTEAMMRQARLLNVDAHSGEESHRAASVARALGKSVVAADAIWPDIPLAGLSDVIIISSAWLKLHFPGVYEYDHALALQEQGAGMIIVTDGPHPVLVVRADGSPFGVEPYVVPEVADTSGAGTMFKAGFIYSWLQPGWTLEHGVKYACAAAALSCQPERCDVPPPSLDEIAELMRVQER